MQVLRRYRSRSIPTVCRGTFIPITGTKFAGVTLGIEGAAAAEPKGVVSAKALALGDGVADLSDSLNDILSVVTAGYSDTMEAVSGSGAMMMVTPKEPASCRCSGAGSSGPMAKANVAASVALVSRLARS